MKEWLQELSTVGELLRGNKRMLKHGARIRLTRTAIPHATSREIGRVNRHWGYAKQNNEQDHRRETAGVRTLFSGSLMRHCFTKSWNDSDHPRSERSVGDGPDTIARIIRHALYTYIYTHKYTHVRAARATTNLSLQPNCATSTIDL